VDKAKLSEKQRLRGTEIWPLVGRSYRYLLQHLGLFWRIGWFWFALTLVLGMIAGKFLTAGVQRYSTELLDLPLVIAFAVAWHRATLLGEAPTGWIGGQLGKREARYAGWVLLLMIVAFVVMVLGIAASYAVTGEVAGGAQIAVVLALLFLVILVATRFVLLLPAVALGDRNASLRWSWRLTKGHSLGLFLAFCSVSLPLLLLKYGLVVALRSFGTGQTLGVELSKGLALLPVYQILDFANMAVSIAFMSFAYEAFTRK
jgi:hypothetical protein